MEERAWLSLSTHLSHIQTARHTPLRHSSPYYQIDGSVELHDWGFWAMHSCVVSYRPLHWPVYGSIGRQIFTLCSSEMPPAIGSEFFPPVLKRGDWEVADWSADLNLKGCAVRGRGEPGQLCYTSPLSIYNAAVAGEGIQSEALNVDILKCIVSLTRAPVKQFWPDVVGSGTLWYFTGNTPYVCGVKNK